MGNSPQDEFAPFADLVRQTYLARPDAATEARHLAAMADLAHDVDHEAIPVRPQGRGLKEAVVTRFRTAAPAVKLAALTLFAALATGGLATAGVISLPNSLPGSASDRATAVHEAIEGVDPSAQAESDDPGVRVGPPEDRGKPETTSEDDVEAQQNGADPEEGAGQAFGDSVSDRASGGEPKEGGRDFGESVSEEAQQLVSHPSPEAQGDAETGQETGETHSQAGRDIAESHDGGQPQD
jgi:hypothetical protein